MPNIYGAATISGSIGLQATPNASNPPTISGFASGAKQNITDFEVSDAPGLEEHKDGNGELIGFVTKDNRLMFSINFTPTGTTKDDCKEAMALLTAPAKVTLAEFPEATGSVLNYNGDWIYVGGATVSWSDGLPRYRLPLMKPLTSPKTVTELTTLLA